MDSNIDDEIECVIIDALDVWFVVGSGWWWIVVGFKCCMYGPRAGRDDVRIERWEMDFSCAKIIGGK